MLRLRLLVRTLLLVEALYLQILTVPMAPSIDPRPLVGEASGYTFRMGRYTREGWGEILPRVAEFIGRARNLQLTGPRGNATSASIELSRAESTIARLKTRLATLDKEAQRLAALREAEREAAEAERRRLVEEHASAPPTN